VVFNAGLKRK